MNRSTGSYEPTIQLTDKQEEEVIEDAQRKYVEYWKERWSRHPLNRSIRIASVPGIDEEAQMTIDKKFDWERFVLLKDCILRHRNKKHLPFASKPKVIPKVFLKRANVMVPKPYCSYFTGNGEYKQEMDLMHEGFSMFSYDERTHFKFNYGNFEAALKITRHIWKERLKYSKGPHNWRNVITPICYEFLTGIQTEINGYDREFMNAAQKLHEEFQEMDEEERGTFPEFCVEKLPDVDPDSDDEINNDTPPSSEDESSPDEVSSDSEHEEDGRPVERPDSSDEDDLMDAPPVNQRAPADRFAGLNQLMEHQQQNWDPPIQPVIPAVSIVASLTVADDRPPIEGLVFQARNERVALNDDRQEKTNPNKMTVRKRPQYTRGDPFVWYPKFNCMEDPRFKRHGHRPEVRQWRDFYTDLNEVYTRIGRPDLARRQLLPYHPLWLRAKMEKRFRIAAVAEKVRELRRHPHVVWNAQGDTYEIPQEMRAEPKPPIAAMNFKAHSNDEVVNPVSKFKCATYRDTIQRRLSNIYTLLLRHKDKMEVFCHLGRFSYLTTFDMALYERQRRKILSIDNLELRGFMSNLGLVRNLQLPRGYFEETCATIKYVREALDEFSFNKMSLACYAVDCLVERWYYRKFNPLCGKEDGVVWKAQGDEKPALKSSAPGASGGPATGKESLDKPITSGEEKVTLKMVDEREIQRTKVPQEKPSKPEPKASAESVYSMFDIVKRPMFIDRIDWGIADESGKELKSWVLPQVYFGASQQSPTVCQNLNAAYVLSMFGAAKFDMKVRIQINSVKFQQGMLMIYFKPFYDESRKQDILHNVTQFAHVKIDASVSNTVELTIPWTNVRDLFPLYADPNAELNYFGTLHVAVWNPLQTGQTGSTDTTISFWMWLENFSPYQLTNPKDPGSIRFATTIRGYEGIANKPLVANETRIDRTLVWVPQAMESIVSTATGIVEDVGANLIESLLSRIARKDNSKPQPSLPPLPVIPHVMTNSSWGSGVDSSLRLSLDPLSCTWPDITKTRPEDLNLLLKEWSRVRVATWNVTDKENAVLLKLPVCPMLNAVTAATTHTTAMNYTDTKWDYETKKCIVQQDATINLTCSRRSGTMLDYFSNLFLYWRGGLRWKFEIVCTSMHSGRIMIRYEPFGTEKSTPKECQKMATPGVVWDVQENHTLEFETPYMAPQPWLQTTFKSEGYVGVDELTQALMGILEVTVINRLKVTTGISSTVGINIYLAAADDFRFACVSPLNGIISLRDDYLVSLPGKVDNDLVGLSHWCAAYLHAGYAIDGIKKNFEEVNNYYALQAPVFKDVNYLGPFAEVMWTAGNLTYSNFVSNVQKIFSLIGKKYFLKTMAIPPKFVSFETAYEWVRHVGLPLPGRAGDPGVADIQKWHFWAAIALSGVYAWKIEAFPKKFSYNYLLVLKVFYDPQPTKQWVAQSNDTASGATIDPFKNFMPAKISDTSLFGENFMNVYTVMKRWNMWMDVRVPDLYDASLVSESFRENNKQFLMDMATMNKWELENYWMEWRIPVTPFHYYHAIGDLDHYFVDMPNAKSQRPMSSSRLPFSQGTADAGSIANITVSRFFGEIFTFWKGSMRYRFTFNDVASQAGSDQTVAKPWYAYVTFHPTTSTDWNTCYEHPRIVHSRRVRDYSKMGMVMFQGNVMGSLDVEIPYYSRFGRLSLSEGIMDATTTNGTMCVYIPLRVLSEIICDPGDVSKFRNDVPRMTVWTAIGDDFEYSVHRAAPTTVLWTPYFRSSPSLKDGNLGWDSFGSTASINTKPIGTLIRDMEELGVKDVEDKHSLHTLGFIQGIPRRSFTEGVTPDKKELEYVKNFQIGVLTEPYKSTQYVAQGNEEPSSEAPPQDPLVVDVDDIDGIMQKVTDFVNVAPTAVKDFHEVVAKAGGVVESLSKTITLLGPALTTLQTKTEEAVKDVKDTSSKISTMATYAFNATRVAIFFKGICDFLSAEDWNGRWLPIAECALALGLSPDIVMKAGEWLMSSLSAIFVSEKVHENIKPQAFEDFWDGSWAAFLENHADTFRLIAAGVITIVTFYMTSSAPITSKVTDFSTGMVHKLRNLAFIGAGFRTLEWMFKWVGTVVKTAVVEVANFVSGGMVTAYQMSNHYPEVVTWLRSVEIYKTEAQRTALAWNPETRLALWHKIDEGQALIDKLSVKTGSLFNTLMKGMAVLQGAFDSALISRAVAPFREDPMHISITGDAGCGKSAILLGILNFVADAAGLPKHHRTYTRCEEDEYWTGYTGQPVVVIDDLYQDKKGKALKELIKMKSNVAMSLNMASVEEKGRQFISKLIGSTTNSAYPRHEEIVHHPAVWRRRNLLIKCYRTKPISTDGVNSYNDMLFDVLNPTDDKAEPIQKGLSYPKLLVMCAEAFMKWTKVQKALVFAALQGKTMEVPDYDEGVTAVVDPEGIDVTFESMKQCILRGIKLSDNFIETIMAKLTAEQVEELTRDRQLFHALTMKSLTFCERIRPMMTLQPWTIWCNKVKAPGAQLGLMEDYVQLKQNNFCMEVVEDGKTFAYASLDGKILPQHGKVLINLTTPGRQYEWKAEGDDLLDSLLTDVYENQENADVAHERLARKAAAFLKEKETLFEGYEGIMADLTRRPQARKTISVKDPVEVSNYVDAHFANESKEIRDKLKADFGKAFSYAVTRTEIETVTREEYARIYSVLFETANMRYWQKAPNGDWEFVMTEDEMLLEKNYEVYSAWEVMKEQMSQEDINKYRSMLIEPQEIKDSLGVGRLEKWMSMQKAKFAKWFAEHPKITLMLKLGGAIGALFVGYKLITWVCPAIFDKIKTIIFGIFGWTVAKIGPDRVDRVTLKVKELGTATKEKAKDYYEWVRSLMIRSGDPELITMTTDKDAVARIAESIPRILKTTKNVAILDQAQVPEGAKKKINPYMIGQDILHTEGTIAQKAAEIPYIYQCQGSADPNATNLRQNKIAKNVCRVLWSNGQRTLNMAGMFIGGRDLLVPYHFFMTCAPGQLFVCTTLNGVEYWDSYQPDRCVRLPQSDVCIYRCGLRMGQFPSLAKHFISSKELNFKYVPATLNVVSEAGVLVVHSIDEARLITEVSYTTQGEQISNALCWEYACRTLAGDCGSPLMADAVSVRQKLLGIHVCGAQGQNLGCAALVFQEDLLAATAMLPEDSKVLPSILVPQELVKEGIEKMKIVPQGNFEYLGAVPHNKAVRLPHQTEIYPSQIHDLVREHVTEPSVLLRNDPRNESGSSPLKQALSKYGVPTLPFNPYDLDYVKSDIQAEVLLWKCPMGKRKLTDHEAVFGNEMIEFCDRMNLGASPGYPWTLSRPSGEKGKAYLYDINAEDGISDETYRYEYRARETLASAGLRKVSLWTDCLKDERRTLEKIKKAKTRAFMLPPADYVQLCRKYFMSFCVTFYSNNIESFSAVGIDPYSYDWTRLVMKLRKKSNLGFGGDFHSFDGIFDPDILWRIGQIINVWYKHNSDRDYDPKDDIIRQVLVEEMIHTTHICLNSVYRKCQGNPSGNPLTVVINTFAHCFYMRLAWLHAARELAPEFASMHRFHQNCTEIYYGDDGLLSIKHAVKDWFNLETVAKVLARHRIEYTSEDKGEELYGVRRVLDCTFLKNGFAKLEDTRLWLAPIADDTIFELTNWIRKSDDPRLQLRENLENALQFAFHHGRDFFERFCNSVNVALRAVNMREIAYSYENTKEQFISKCRV